MWRLISSPISQFSTVVSHGDIVVSDCRANKQSAENWQRAHAMPFAAVLKHCQRALITGF